MTATHCSHAQTGSLFFDVRTTSVQELMSGMPTSSMAAVILLGITAIDACARDPVTTAEVNVGGVIHVIDELHALGILPVFVSSDGVFDGRIGRYRESAQTNPILTYGRQKLEVERYLALSGRPYIVVRLPKVLATDRDSRCMLTSWVDALGRNERILCATDQYFTPAGAHDIARAIVKLITERARGVFHLGGPDRLSRRNLLAMVVSEYRKHAEPKAEIVECSLRDIPVLEPRPMDTSLDSRKFQESFGLPFLAMEEVVRQAVWASCGKSSEAERVWVY